MHLPRRAVVALTGPNYRIGLWSRWPVRVQRAITDAAALGLLPPRGTSVRKLTLGGRPAERVTVGATERPRAILYLHGGAYNVGSARMYRAMAGFLARTAEAVVFTLDYSLAPEHPYPAALDDAVAAFHQLMDAQGYPADRIAIAGDSAGGGLAVATACRLRDEDVHPAAVALISPWTDPSDFEGMAKRDFVVSRAWGQTSAERYRGDADPKDPGFAPMYADLTGLPPMLIHYGATESLRDQIVRFAGRAEAAGVKVELVEHPLLWHSAHQLAGMLREATDAVDDLGRYLRARTG